MKIKLKYSSSKKTIFIYFKSKKYIAVEDIMLPDKFVVMVHLNEKNECFKILK
jgi:hypothetical protein